MALLIEPLTYDSERGVAVQTERTHEVRHGPIHIGAAVGPQPAEEAEEEILVVCSHADPNINRSRFLIKAAAQSVRPALERIARTALFST